MSLLATLRRQPLLRSQITILGVSLVVGIHGLFILATTLFDQLAVHRGAHNVSDVIFDLPLLIGVSFIYLSALLRRQKRTAWLVTMIIYGFYLGLGVSETLTNFSHEMIEPLRVIRSLIVPALILLILIVQQDKFVVRSDIQGFRGALRFSALMLVAALLYGTVGFLLLDETDFHREISMPGAIQYTVDRFNITTSEPIQPHTYRAHLFVDSLSVVSVAAIGYVVLSFFQPLRQRLGDQTAQRQHFHKLMEHFGAPSEDYFKLWPHDKQYFFDASQQSGLAFGVHRGIAMVVGDPIGSRHHFGQLLDEFQRLCFHNDWQPGVLYVEDRNRPLYEERGYQLQKIGEEAVLDIDTFVTTVYPDKYFRQINNRFTKLGFTAELLQPPHHKAVIDRLRSISEDWLEQDGRVERGFAMGYFSEDYIQACPIMIARDAAGTIQAFLNQLPASFDKEEADFDLLRHAEGSPGNINDYLMMHFALACRAQGYQRLNMGLCPLVGLDKQDDKRASVLNNVLHFAYANGDPVYSFSGLHRFKAKYQPVWRDRYIAYQGGIRGFSRTATALMFLMRVKTTSHRRFRSKK